MISSWPRLIAATLVAGVFVLALVSRGHSQSCVTVLAPSEARDCIKFDVTCGNNRVNLIWGPDGSPGPECGRGVKWGYDCFYNNLKVAGSQRSFDGSISGSQEHSATNGEYCVYYACVEIYNKYYLLSNGTVTCIVPPTTSTRITASVPSLSVNDTVPSTTSTGITSTYSLSSESHTTISSTTIFPTSSSDSTGVPSLSVNDTVSSTTSTGITSTYSESHTTISSTTIFPTPSSDSTSVSSSLVNDTVPSTTSTGITPTYSLSSESHTTIYSTTIFPTSSSDSTSVSSSLVTVISTSSSVNEDNVSTIDTSLLPSLNSSVTASPGTENNSDQQTITIATIVTVGITIAVVILIGLWIKMTRRNKKQLQELIFYDKIEVGALVFIETKSKSLVTLTESLEPVEQSGSFRPIIIHGQENEANPPPAYSETEDMFCSAIKDTLPSQEQIYLTNLSDENGDLTFIEGVPTQTDDVVSVNSYLDTASPPQQQHQQLYNTTLSGIKKETTSIDGSSIFEMFESDGLRTSSDTEHTCARFSMIERDDGYLATT